MDNQNRWKYEVVDINLIEEAEKNANEMSNEEFDTLVENIDKSGLSSVPCCYKKEDGRFVMISGHHRLRACKKLKYKTIGILFCDEAELSKDEIIAIQLSHNSLHGQDNKNILKQLFEQIQSIDFKKFAHVNIDEIAPVPTDGVSMFAMKENFVFTAILYPDKFEAFDELYDDVREQAKKSDVVVLADKDLNEMPLLKLQKEVSKGFSIKSPSITFTKILELAAMKLNEIRENK